MERRGEGIGGAGGVLWALPGCPSCRHKRGQPQPQHCDSWRETIGFQLWSHNESYARGEYRKFLLIVSIFKHLAVPIG